MGRWWCTVHARQTKERGEEAAQLAARCYCCYGAAATRKVRTGHSSAARNFSLFLLPCFGWRHAGRRGGEEHGATRLALLMSGLEHGTRERWARWEEKEKRDGCLVIRFLMWGFVRSEFVFIGFTVIIGLGFGFPLSGFH